MNITTSNFIFCVLAVLHLKDFFIISVNFHHSSLSLSSMFGCWIQICSSDVTNGVAMTNKRIKTTLDFDVSGHRTWGESIGLWRRHRTLESYKFNLFFYCPILLFIPQLLWIHTEKYSTFSFSFFCFINREISALVYY